MCVSACVVLVRFCFLDVGGLCATVHTSWADACVPLAATGMTGCAGRWPALPSSSRCSWSHGVALAGHGARLGRLGLLPARAVELDRLFGGRVWLRVYATVGVQTVRRARIQSAASTANVDVVAIAAGHRPVAASVAARAAVSRHDGVFHFHCKSHPPPPVSTSRVIPGPLFHGVLAIPAA